MVMDLNIDYDGSEHWLCQILIFPLSSCSFLPMLESVQIITLMKQPIFPWSICSQGSIFWTDQLIISSCVIIPCSPVVMLLPGVVIYQLVVVGVSPAHQLNYRYRADLPLFTDSLRLFAHISVNTAVSLISPFFGTTSIKPRIFQLLSNW